MLSRRSFVIASFLSIPVVFGPLRAFGAPSDDRRIPVNPNPQDIVNGPTVIKKRRVSFAQLKRSIGHASDAASIAASIGAIIGIPPIAVFLVDFVSNNIGWILMATDEGSPNHGLEITYRETIRYYVNPATGHKEYYETSYGFMQATSY